MDTTPNQNSSSGTPIAEDYPADLTALSWRDGNGDVWNIQANPEALTLIGPDGEYVLPRSGWRSAIRFAPSGGSVVMHIDLGDREVGFLAPRDEALQLLNAMGRDEAATARPVARPAQPVARPAAPSADSPAWPKMTTGSIWAICLSTLTFLPFVGLLFGAIAVLLAVRSLRSARPNAAFLHIRVINRLAIAIAMVGAVVCCAAGYLLIQHWPISEFQWFVARVHAIGEPAEWHWGAGVAAFVMVIIALSIHEAAHAISAWWLGDDYARSIGRVTLNPLSHIDPFGTILLPIMLAMAGWPVFGYARPVPVRPGVIRHHRRAHILISAAGPLSNLLQAGICLMLLMALGMVLGRFVSAENVINFTSRQPMVEVNGIAGGQVIAAAVLMLKLGVQINILLAFFNLIPVPPLDGSWVVENLFPNSLGRVYAMIRPYGFLVFIGLFYSNALDYFFKPAFYLLFEAQTLVSLVTGF